MLNPALHPTGWSGRCDKMIFRYRVYSQRVSTLACFVRKLNPGCFHFDCVVIVTLVVSTSTALCEIYYFLHIDCVVRNLNLNTKEKT